MKIHYKFLQFTESIDLIINGVFDVTITSVTDSSDLFTLHVNKKFENTIKKISESERCEAVKRKNVWIVTHGSYNDKITAYIATGDFKNVIKVLKKTWEPLQVEEEFDAFVE